MIMSLLKPKKNHLLNLHNLRNKTTMKVIKAKMEKLLRQIKNKILKMKAKIIHQQKIHLLLIADQ